MNNTINIYVNDNQLKLAQMFSNDLGYLMFNIAVIIAPFDTGNLRRAITLSNNKRTIKTVSYNLMDANYIRFLEKGQGPVKQYEGFISIDTKTAIAESVITYILTGSYPFLSKIPTVQLKDTDKIFSAERRIIEANDVKTSKINADIRRRVSRMREQEHRLKNGISDLSFRKGVQVQEIKSFGYGSGKGNNILSKVYNQRLQKEIVRF